MAFDLGDPNSDFWKGVRAGMGNLNNYQGGADVPVETLIGDVTEEKPSDLTPPPPPPSPTPPSLFTTTPTFVASKGIRQAQPDIVIDSGTDTSGDYIAERFFEELGGTELISLSRHDLIDGITVVYNPIANLSLLRRRYNPNNVIALSFLSDNEFSRAGIDLLSREPGNPYFDDNGNLVIEVGIIRSEENIEAEISLSGTVTRIEL